MVEEGFVSTPNTGHTLYLTVKDIVKYEKVHDQKQEQLVKDE